MMQQAHKHFETVHTDYVNAVHDVFSSQDKGNVDESTTIHDEGNDVQGQVIDDNAQHTTNEATEVPMPCDQVFNKKDPDVQDQSVTQHADDTMQQRSNTVVDAQAREDDDNVHGPTSDAMHKRNQDEHDKPEGQHADDPVDETPNEVRNAPITDDQRVEWMELPSESQWLDVSTASPLSPSCTGIPSSALHHLLLPMQSIVPIYTNLSC
jgi:hypothetical protein